MIQDEATALFNLLCNGVAVSLHHDESLQPEYIVSSLPRTDDIEQSCTSDYLPHLKVDQRLENNEKENP